MGLSNACFLFLIIIVPSKHVPDLITSTSFTPIARFTVYFIVICQASYCPYEMEEAYCVYIRELSDSSPGLNPSSPCLKVTGKISLAGC